MIRVRRIKPVALILAALLTGTVGGGPFAHDCPMHEAIVPGAQPTAMPHGSMAPASLERQSMAHPSAQRGTGPGVGSGAEHGDEHSGPCQCIGVCHGGSAAPLVASDGVGFNVAQTVQPKIARVSDAIVLPQTSRYLLPFPLGPPVQA